MSVVAYEIAKAVFGFLGSVLGLEGVVIGVLTAGVVGLWYLHELAGVFQVIARYSRTFAVVGAIVLALLVLGSVSGVVEVGQAFNQLTEAL
ncbi:hypothetical protein ACFQER_16010 [Halomicroarcula sp. GCM10025894]|uniref:hypothetical protein n=1 Tax=Halomicroarcula sp. GCM10025894 TaxID=3252673 RepID=UPI00361BFC82